MSQNIQESQKAKFYINRPKILQGFWRLGRSVIMNWINRESFCSYVLCTRIVPFFLVLNEIHKSVSQKYAIYGKRLAHTKQGTRGMASG